MGNGEPPPTPPRARWRPLSHGFEVLVALTSSPFAPPAALDPGVCDVILNIKLTDLGASHFVQS